MRQLLYVPIMHGEADLGTVGPVLAQESARLLGERRWRLHQATVRRFWQQVAEYLLSRRDLRGAKVFQDGLAADGEEARRIIEEVARRGSANYRLLQSLLHHGAKFPKTEDPALLVRERETLLRALRGGFGGRSSEAYRAEQDQLLRQRDRFIVRTIDQSLAEGDIGILFIGAHHDVLPHLACDIVVEKVKEPAKVRAYFAALLSGQNEEKLQAFVRDLTAPVGAS